MKQQKRSADATPAIAERFRPAQVDENPQHQARYGTVEDETEHSEMQPEEHLPSWLDDAGNAEYPFPHQKEDDDDTALTPYSDSLPWRTEQQYTEGAVSVHTEVVPSPASETLLTRRYRWRQEEKRRHTAQHSNDERESTAFGHHRTAGTGTTKRRGGRRHDVFRMAAYTAASSQQEDDERAQELHQFYYYGGALPVRLLHKAKQYTLRLSASVAKARTLATEKAVVANVLKTMIPVLFSAAVLLSLLLAILLPTMTLKSELEDMTEAYLYVTELDAKKTKEIRDAMPGGGGTFYINDYPVSSVSLQTSVDYLMLYLTVKYEDFTLGTKLAESAFGGNTVREELQNIHRQLYSYRVKYTTDEEGEPVLDGVYVTSRSASELLDRWLTEDEREMMETISSIGIYAAYQCIEMPFADYAYVKERWGAYVDDRDSIAYRTEAVLAAGRSSAVLACADGEITVAQSGTVCIEMKNGGRIQYDGLQLVLASQGQQVRTGDEIGAVSSDLYLTCYSENGDIVNPAFLLPSATEYGGGSGDGAGIVAAALTQLGQVGGQPYWSWYGFSQQVDWCACFVSWCAEQAGCLQTAVPRFSLVDDGELWYKRRGLWQNGGMGYVPRAGDIIFFDWEMDGRPNHVGIVQNCDGALICAVEGNSGDYPGIVRVRYYDIHSSVIYGFGTPNYG